MSDSYLIVGNMKQAGKNYHQNARVYILLPKDSGRAWCMLKTRSGRLIKTWLPLNRIADIRTKRYSADNSDHRYVNREWHVHDFDSGLQQLQLIQEWAQ